MSLIKPRTRGKEMLRVITRLDRENHDTLEAYAAFLGEPTEYVLNELIDTVLAKDRDFVKWRAEQTGEHRGASSPTSRSRSTRRGDGPSGFVNDGRVAV